MQDLELALDGERRAAEDAKQSATLLERKRIALQTELEDVRALLDAVSSLSSLFCQFRYLVASVASAWIDCHISSRRTDVIIPLCVLSNIYADADRQDVTQLGLRLCRP